jgi:hypothetical protein
MPIEDIDMEELGKHIHWCFRFTLELLGEANRTEVEAECEALMSRVQGNRSNRSRFGWPEYVMVWTGALERCQEILSDAEKARP